MGFELNFLDLDPSESNPDSAQTVVLPVPYERTVSFRGGCSRGPMAIIEASRSIELYDEELGINPAEGGIHTAPEIECDIDPAQMVKTVKNSCLDFAREGKFVLTLGGEHSVTVGAFAAQKEIHSEISVLSIDAHCDLRDSYQGSKFSHACVMRRIVEAGASHIVIAGVRSMSAEEAGFAVGREDLSIVSAEKILEEKLLVNAPGQIMEKLGRKVYLSIDADGLDPSIMPSVGTPEPGGMGWTDVISLLRAVFESREVVGMDIVELAPIPGFVAPDVTAAKMACKAIGYKLGRSRQS
ncbi:MAG: agmatinase [Candidatus Mycalebacterium zealandia]|nr:MAG: agmatinase [Candidatus Mycalebacterium zealandia]